MINDFSRRNEREMDDEYNENIAEAKHKAFYIICNRTRCRMSTEREQERQRERERTRKRKREGDKKQNAFKCIEATTN